jgi:hypothetical protein
MAQRQMSAMSESRDGVAATDVDDGFLRFCKRAARVAQLYMGLKQKHDSPRALYFPGDFVSYRTRPY